MFICKQCHDEYYECWHMSVSYGPCEDCHKNAECYDCSSSRAILKEKNKDLNNHESKRNEDGS